VPARSPTDIRPVRLTPAARPPPPDRSSAAGGRPRRHGPAGVSRFCDGDHHCADLPERSWSGASGTKGAPTRLPGTAHDNAKRGRRLHVHTVRLPRARRAGADRPLDGLGGRHADGPLGVPTWPRTERSGGRRQCAVDLQARERRRQRLRRGHDRRDQRSRAGCERAVAGGVFVPTRGRPAGDVGGRMGPVRGRLVRLGGRGSPTCPQSRSSSAPRKCRTRTG